MPKKPRRPLLSNPNCQGLLVLAVVIAIAGVYLLNNRQPQQTVARPALPPTSTVAPLEDWQLALQAELAALPSATPTPPNTATPSPQPTLPGAQATVQVFQPESIGVMPFPTGSPLPTLAITPAPFVGDSTPVPLPTGLDVGLFPTIESNPEKYQLPPEQVPLSASPFDHFFLTRPIDVTANSEYLFYYPYGSDGQQGWRIHHGLDMPNPVGEEVRAAGPGTVIWADRTYKTELDGELEVYAAYGNVVVIEHTFGWRGQKVWTLYAHMSAILVKAGDTVETGDILGLVGLTGSATGPHVHFEVRVGRNSYFSTRNPLLWMAPYIGHGVVAGRVVDRDGNYLDDVLIQLNRGGRITDSTTTYINPYVQGKRIWSVVPDDSWQENFVLGDIPAGEYQLVAVVDGERTFQTVNVTAGTTTFVEIQIGNAATPQAVPATAIVLTPIPTALPSPTPTR